MTANGKEDEEDMNSIFFRASGSDNIFSGVKKENEPILSQAIFGN